MINHFINQVLFFFSFFEMTGFLEWLMPPSAIAGDRVNRECYMQVCERGCTTPALVHLPVHNFIDNHHIHTHIYIYIYMNVCV